VVQLALDNNAHVLHVRAFTQGTVILAVGETAIPPIRFGEIKLDVQPDYLLNLGTLGKGEFVTLPVPRYLRALHAEAVLIDNELSLHDSNTVALIDAYLDLVDATFRAVLVSTDSIPPEYTFGAALTAPTNGYEFRVDGLETEDGVTNVFLRLIEPGQGDVVLPVLTDYQVTAHIGAKIGTRVDVYLMRIGRGAIGPEVYRLMVRLPVPDEK
jgi:hypothetical protein